MARDMGYMDDACFGEVMKEAEEVARLIGAMRASVADRMR